MGALRAKARTDAGRHRRLSLRLREALLTQYREHRGWSVQLHYDNLAIQVSEDPTLGPLPSYATLRRYYHAQGLRKTYIPHIAGGIFWQLSAQRMRGQRGVR